MIIRYNKNKYFIKNYNISRIIFGYIFLIIIHIIGFSLIIEIITQFNRINIIKCIFDIIFFIIFYISNFILFNNIKKIIIYSNKVIFKCRLIPYTKIIKLDINEIKEISINYSIHSINILNKGKINNKIYNIDLIDYKSYSYRILQSEVYNDDLLDFSKELSKILNKHIHEQNDIEGNKNVYIKSII